MTVELPSYIYEFFSQYNYTPKQKRALNWYLSIIAKRYDRGIDFCNNASSIEVHHIIPKSIGPQYQYERSNMVPLTIREHVILHHLLSLTGIEKMEYAFHAVCDYRDDLHDHIPITQAALLIEKSRTAISHPVRNLTTGELFPSVAAACKAYNSKTNLHFAIRTRIKACKCYWQYEDIIQLTSIQNELNICKQQAKQRRRIHAIKHGKPIVNLNTGEVFEISSDADQWLQQNVDSTKKYNTKYAAEHCIPCGGYFWQFKDNVVESIDQELQKMQRIYRTNHAHLIVIDLSTGIQYENCAKAGQALNLDKNAINRVARVGGMHGNRYWMHLDLFNQFGSCQKAIEYREQQKRQNRLNGQIKKSTAVYCLDTGKRYINVNFAARDVGCCATTIIESAKTKIRYKGLCWAYEPDVLKYGIDSLLQQYRDPFPRKKPVFTKPRKSQMRAVVNLNTGQVFDSISDAVQSVGGHCNVVGGIKNNTKVKGYYWQYKDIVDQSSVEAELQKCKQIAYQRRHKSTKPKIIRKQRNKPIINLNTGKVYHTKRELASLLGVSEGIIADVIKNHKRLNGDFYQLQSIVDDTSIEQQLQICIQEEQKRKNKIPINARKICNLTTGQIFDSVTAAQESIVNKTKGNIAAAISAKTSCGGYYWQYEDVLQNSSIELEMEKYKLARPSKFK